MFIEHDGLYVGQIDDHVNNGKLQIRIFLRHFFNSSSLCKARSNDWREALVGKIADGLFALGFVGDFKFAIGNARIGLEFFRAIEHRFVERLVKLATDIKHDGRFVVGGICRYGQHGRQCRSTE